MTDDPTIVPPPVVDELPPEPPPRPRNPVGWIVSGVFLFLMIALAVGEYASQKTTVGSLEQELEVSVLLEPGVPVFGGSLQDIRDDKLASIAERAAGMSEDTTGAARIAAAAYHELGREVPLDVVESLTASEDETSQLLGELYTDSLSDVEREQLLRIESDEFSVRLAQAHAREAAGATDADADLTGEVGPAEAAFTLGGLLLLGVGAVCLVLFIVWRANGSLVPVGFSRLDKSDGDRLMIRFASYLFLFAMVGVFAAVLLQSSLLENVSEVWLSAGVMVVTLALLVVFLKPPVLGEEDSVSKVVGPKEPLGKLIKAGLFGYLCTVPLLAVSLVLISVMSLFFPAPSHPIGDDMASAGATEWLLIALSAAVLAPLIEEVTFRGLLLPALATQIKRTAVAILLCGLIFAAIHPQGPLAWPALATTGVAAATLRHYTGSLIPSIVLHMVHNALIVVVGYFFG